MPAPVRPGFGWLRAYDARDKQYPMKAVTRRIELPTSKIWYSNKTFVLDQGQTPHCVGFAWAGFLEASPFAHQLQNADGDRFYSLAQQFDEWPGEAYDGSSTRGGAKALQSLGYIEGSYVWAQSEADVWKFVLTRGPVVTGTTWLTGMFDPIKGYLKITGGEEGGHDWLIIGASQSRNAYRMQNSWGSEWGENGRAWIKRDDYRVLFEELGGDCCSAVEVAKAV